MGSFEDAGTVTVADVVVDGCCSAATGTRTCVRPRANTVVLSDGSAD